MSMQISQLQATLLLLHAWVPSDRVELHPYPLVKMNEYHTGTIWRDCSVLLFPTALHNTEKQTNDVSLVLVMTASGVTDKAVQACPF